MNYVSPTLPMRRIKNVYFVGIGGVGMSGNRRSNVEFGLQGIRI